MVDNISLDVCPLCNRELGGHSLAYHLSPPEEGLVRPCPQREAASKELERRIQRRRARARA